MCFFLLSNSVISVIFLLGHQSKNWLELPCIYHLWCVDMPAYNFLTDIWDLQFTPDSKQQVERYYLAVLITH